MFRLPDIPIVGYQTRRQREGTDAIMLFMRKIERDRLRLLTIVCEGPDKWRTVASQIFGTALGIGTEQIDEMYRYFTLQASPPRVQAAMLEAIEANDTDRYRNIVKFAMPGIEAQRERLRAAQN